MKKILISLFTFLLGVFAFNLLHFEKVTTSQTSAPIKKAVETPQTRIEYFPNQKLDNSKPFFNSFNDGEGYGGWLIADKFRGMREVWTILLSRDSEDSNDEKLIWSAMVLTMNSDGEPNDDDNFQSVWIKTEDNRLSFRTNKIRGVAYKFDGEFFKNGKEFSDDEKVLKGTLRKIVRGKETAKFTANFAYHEPVCFH